MRADLAEACPNCGDQAIAFDSDGLCYVCQSCGFVPHEQGLVSYEETAARHGEEHESHGGGTAGVSSAYALASSHHAPYGGSTAAIASGPYDPRLAATIRSAADPAGQSRERRQRQQLDELQGLGARLKLPGPVVHLAAGFLSRIHAAAAAEGPAASRTDTSQLTADAPYFNAAATGAYGNPNAAATGAYGNPDADPNVAPRSRSPGPQTEADADPNPDADSDPDADPGELPGASGGRGLSRRERGRGRVPLLGGQQSAARLGALLYLASRSERGTLTLAEVGAATCTDMFWVGELARHQAAFLHLHLPAMDLERFVLRIALELISSTTSSNSSGRMEPPGPDTPDTRATAPNAAHGGPGGAPRAPVSESQLRSHPLVRTAMQLVALVVRRGWHEGKTPRTVAGALLSICMDAVYPAAAAAGQGSVPGPGQGSGPWAPGGGGPPLTTLQQARSAMCGTTQLVALKQEVLGHLTRLASSLPFGPLVSPANVAAYLDVIMAADEVLLGGAPS